MKKSILIGIVALCFSTMSFGSYLEIVHIEAGASGSKSQLVEKYVNHTGHFYGMTEAWGHSALSIISITDNDDRIVAYAYSSAKGNAIDCHESGFSYDGYCKKASAYAAITEAGLPIVPALAHSYCRLAGTN